jgi:hypothetical protein
MKMIESSVCSEYLLIINEAEKILIKAQCDEGVYKYIRPVKQACGIVYKVVLKAINKYVRLKEGPKSRKPLNIEEYRERLTKLDPHLRAMFEEAYNYLYIIGHYHGTQSERSVQYGFISAREIIVYIGK